MTASELKIEVEARRTETHFFDRKTMKFFGDTMRNYGVRDGRKVTTYSGQKVEVWELYRRHAVKHGLQSSAYFNKVTFERVFPDKER